MHGRITWNENIEEERKCTVHRRVRSPHPREQDWRRAEERDEIEMWVRRSVPIARDGVPDVFWDLPTIRECENR